MPDIQRMTTLFNAAEDRFQLVVELDDGKVVELWLTQRLLQRLLPALLKWLQEQAPADKQHAEVLHDFAQQAAREAHGSQSPVQASSDSEVERRLIQSMDVIPAAGLLRLVFKDRESQAATLSLQALPLRQWLNILYDGYALAGWPLQVWPDWMSGGGVAAEKTTVLH